MKWFKRGKKTNPEKQEMENLYGYRGCKDRVNYLRRFLRLFDPGGQITTDDLVEALYIIQREGRLKGMDFKQDAYRIVDLLARCALEITTKGKIRLSPGSLNYIRQKLPLEPFVKAEIARIKEVEQGGTLGIESETSA